MHSPPYPPPYHFHQRKQKWANPAVPTLVKEDDDGVCVGASVHLARANYAHALRGKRRLRRWEVGWRNHF